MIIDAAFALLSVLGLCLLSFWIGRCARRVPILDERLPWTLRLDDPPRCLDDDTEECKK